MNNEPLDMMFNHLFSTNIEKLLIENTNHPKFPYKAILSREGLEFEQSPSSLEDPNYIAQLNKASDSKGTPLIIKLKDLNPDAFKKMLSVKDLDLSKTDAKGNTLLFYISGAQVDGGNVKLTALLEAIKNPTDAKVAKNSPFYNAYLNKRRDSFMKLAEKIKPEKTTKEALGNRANHALISNPNDELNLFVIGDFQKK